MTRRDFALAEFVLIAFAAVTCAYYFYSNYLLDSHYSSFAANFLKKILGA